MRGDGGDAALDAVAAEMAGLSLDEIARVVRLATARFHLLNKAEQLNIVRVNRERERASADGPARPESLDGAFERLVEAGWDGARIRALIGQLDVQPTLTAHPTEARRRTVLEKQLDVAECVVALRDASLTAAERAATEGRLERVVSLLLATDDVRSRRLDVPDEVRNGLYFLRTTIWQTVPRLARDAASAALRALGTEQSDIVLCDLPAMLRYRSWIGGDRDGNPRVTADVTRRTLAMMRDEARRLWDAELATLQDELTLSTRRVEIAPKLMEAIERDEHWGLTGPEFEHRRYEPIRLRLFQMRSRLAEDEAYTAAMLLDDLLLIRETLAAAGLAEVGEEGRLADAIVRARAFGLHLATLDVRQHSGVHERVIAEMLALAGVEADYAGLDESERVALLRRELGHARPLLRVNAELSDDAAELLGTLRVVADAVAVDADAVRSYVISMTHGVSDLLELLVLLKEVGLHEVGVEGAPTRSRIRVVPLFETVEDLDIARTLMGELLDDPVYRSHVEATGGEQEIMLGYSDSNKDGGFLMANVALHEAQRSIADAITSRGVGLRFFHGRGGTIGRGGGRAGRAILAAPPAARTGRIRFTEQGEVITFRYALPAMARRHIEQIIHASMLGASGIVDSPDDSDLDTLLRQLAERAREAYRGLIDDPAFWPWFVAASPVEHIGGMPIASRPVSRATGDRLNFDSLRAIPWVFAWVQMRALAPGWYGLGTAMASATDGERAALREAFGRSPFVQSVFENASQELARARMPIVARYARLAGGGDDAVLGKVTREFASARDAVLDATGRDDLMAHARVVGESIEARNPMTDLLNLAQIELVKRHRAASENDRERVLAAIRSTINGLAAAMQSTG